MKNLKKLPTKQLEKFSNIFMQLGLVLVLFIVYVTLEHQTEQESVAFFDPDMERTIYLEPNTEVLFTKEPKAVPKLETPKPIPFIIDEIKKGNDETLEPIIDISHKTPVPVDPNTIIEVDIPDKEGPETVDFILIEDAPVFKGCENLSKAENKSCFDKKIKQFIQRNFDIELANELGLQSGNHRIYTEFVIDKFGDIIDVKVRAPHKQLEKEANRLIHKLPKFTPGKQRKKPVKVKYTLPIAFSVE